MNGSLTVVGGTYLEICTDPYWFELYGSGLRGAASISNFVSDIKLYSVIGEDMAKDATAICKSFNIIPDFTQIKDTVSFSYHHPLSTPISSYSDSSESLHLTDVSSDNVLYYGMIEADVSVKGDYVIYDPQNWAPFGDTKSIANHLALVLNKNEALMISGGEEGSNLLEIGRQLQETQRAEVVVIKNGAHGALVFDSANIYEIPIFKTASVWPIGSGDIFSAVFACKWAVERVGAYEAAYTASTYTAQYCESRVLPLGEPEKRLAISKKQKRRIYLAGPFFNMAQRWLIDEVRRCLLEFGNDVFSPYHDVGFGETKSVAARDLEGLRKSDVILAILDGLDAGTLFEIGYARALDKRVIILSESVHKDDLLMMIGSDCEITTDFSTAIYQTSW
ncbi:MAG: hypothetical protein BGO21_26210 [Dyadobacter sp. 50-39]|uniref:PfkB family carbohydrate kinase n=1 Tax=Dyadobacter sp. 50-39 TaxID=1895756 RepID=UPI000959DBC4|nr:PfkB family carbohydrate kinase [Dyadobacter sp. 50-39]OJV16395.1 MAG: hypothetical protein BGO21_26210 [Dyadobacter sp. 50-39]